MGNLDSDYPIVFIYYYKWYMKNFLNQSKLRLLLGTVFTLYTKDVHSLAFHGWFPKRCLLIKVENIYQCAHNIYQLNFFYYVILWKSLTFRIWPIFRINLDRFVNDGDVALFNRCDI